MARRIMRKKRLSREEKDILIEKISAVLKARKYIVFAYIFGSFVSRDSFNDIDAGIFISNMEDISPLKLELEIEAELEDAVHIPVDVRIINNAPPAFVFNILKNKIAIVNNDRGLMADFEGLIFKKYSDLQHLRREYLREAINAPV